MNRIRYNRTKIVATLGPATQDYETIKQMIIAGVDVFRLNFSHGGHKFFAELIKNIRAANEELNTYTCILGDLQGPKLRVGEMENGGIELENGSLILLTRDKVKGNAKKIQVSYDNLARDIEIGERVLLDDGKLELEFTKIVDLSTVEARVIVGGKLLSKKGFNLPSTNLSTPSLTEKDKIDLEFMMEEDVDWIGLSFVRSARDIQALKTLLNYHKKKAKVIAKIEKPQAIDNLDDIIMESDGIMVARGDLGVEMPMEKVPIIQKDICKKCIVASKPVIIATQMMESMIESPTPTRAEANDVANAVLDGADAVMLSAETSIGKYPLRAIRSVEKILDEVENYPQTYYKGEKPKYHSPSFLSDEICFTAVRMSDHINASAIVSMTHSGYTAFKISSFRPNCEIFIFTENKEILNQLSLVWGVRAIFYDKVISTDDTMSDVIEILKEKGYVKKDQLLINTASMPIHERQRTNTLKITKVS